MTRSEKLCCHSHGRQQNFIMFEKKKFSNVVDILILNAPSKRGSGMKPKVRARASELSPEPGYLNFRFLQN